MARCPSCLIVGLTVQVVLPCAEAERVTTHVDLQAPNAAAQWVLPAHSGASIKNGELILDGVKHRGSSPAVPNQELGDDSLENR